MCYANFTQHSGCGHIGESQTRPVTLCDHALRRLFELRGPNSPPLSEPAAAHGVHGPPQKRSASKRRFFSLSGTLSRTASVTSRRTASTGPGVRRSTSAASSFTPTTTVLTQLDYATLPQHQLNAVRCAELVRRSQVAIEMDVCQNCKTALMAMRNMLERYEKTGSIRGTTAFEQFLRFGDEGLEPQHGDVTIPIQDCAGGEILYARQAIVLGHASDMPQLKERGGAWDTDGDVETLSDHVRQESGPRRAVVMGHPSDASLLVDGGTHGLGYWKGDDVSSLATSRVFR